MSVSFSFIDNFLNGNATPQLYRMQELASYAKLARASDASKGEVAKAVKRGLCPLSNPSINARDVLFVLSWEMSMISSDRLMAHTVLLNGAAYRCTCVAKVVNGDDAYTPMSIVPTTINVQKLTSSIVPRPITGSVRGVQQSFSASEMSSSSDGLYNTDEESPYNNNATGAASDDEGLYNNFGESNYNNVYTPLRMDQSAPIPVQQQKKKFRFGFGRG